MNMTKDKREAAIVHRLTLGKMPYKRDWDGQPPERIKAWQEHVMAYKPGQARAKAEERHTEIELGGYRYRVTRIAGDSHPQVHRWTPDSEVRKTSGYVFIRAAHWKRILGRAVIEEVLRHAKA